MKANRGFTLIELMVVVGIIAILAAIAIPTYLQHVRKSRRGYVEDAMLQAAMLQEKFRADCPSYGTSFGAVGACTNIGTNPYNPSTPYYTLTIGTPAPTSTSYVLSAVAISSTGQNKDSASGTNCATLTYAQNSGVITKSPGDCWGNN